MKLFSLFAAALLGPLLPGAPRAFAQTVPAPAAENPAPASAPPVGPAPADPFKAETYFNGDAILLLEVFSMAPATARKALIAYPKEGALHTWLDASLEKNDSGVKLERTSALRTRSGQRGSTASTDDYPYGTEADPPQIPQTISLPAGATDTPVAGGERKFPAWPVTPRTPNSYLFRNLGWTSDAEIIISADNKTADVALSSDMVRVLARVPQGLHGEISMPVFESVKCTTHISAPVGQPALVSSFSPPVNTGVPGGNKEDRVWLLFVTVTLPQ